MTAVVVGESRRLTHVDPATVWSLVADPEQLEKWAPVRFVGWMGTELPGVGQAFFVTFHKRQDPQRAVRFRINTWEAGQHFSCVIEGKRVGRDERVDVDVSTLLEGGATEATVGLRYSGEHSWWVAPLAGAVARRRLRRAVDGIEAACR